MKNTLLSIVAGTGLLMLVGCASTPSSTTSTTTTTSSEQTTAPATSTGTDATLR